MTGVTPNADGLTAPFSKEVLNMLKKDEKIGRSIKLHCFNEKKRPFVVAFFHLAGCTGLEPVAFRSVAERYIQFS